MKHIALLLVCMLAVAANAQYAPQVGVSGTTAIAATSGQFAGWASHCSIRRGYLDIAQPALGKASVGDSTGGVGPSDNSVVSLGDSGIAVLTFQHPIFNGAGPDFAVFENGFQNPNNEEEAFLELAFVEVSSDGVNYTRFPSTSLTPLTSQIPIAGVYMNARLINNLAGKYIGGYGTPFDLDELAGTPGLDLNNITHVRVVDVIGAINNWGSTDHLGNKVNDPYPTAVPGSGFELDAVGVLHMVGVNAGVTESAAKLYSIYPNPASSKVFIDTKGQQLQYIFTDVTGKLLQSGVLGRNGEQLDIAHNPQGIYYLQLQDKNGNKWQEKIIKI